MISYLSRLLFWPIQKYIQTIQTTELSPPLPSIKGRLDLFYKFILRQLDENPKYEENIISSWNESPIDTMKLIFNCRDCRGGKGERLPFILSMRIVSNKYPEWFEANFKHIPTYGRWLDLIELYSILDNEEHKKQIVEYLADQLIEDQDQMGWGEGISFLAKWIPSENKKYDRMTDINDEICKKLFNTKTVNSYILCRYRKEFISPLRHYLSLCEQKMCKNEWDDISYANVPIVALERYYRAFKKHSPERFQKWLNITKKNNPSSHASSTNPNENLAPYEFMRKTIDNPRYNAIVAPGLKKT